MEHRVPVQRRAVPPGEAKIERNVKWNTVGRPVVMFAGTRGEAKIERNVKWNWDGISSTCTACGEGNVKRNKP